MGICLEAQVEIRDGSGAWVSISRWDLGKGFEALEHVRQVCRAGFPPDPHMNEEDLVIADSGQSWVELGRWVHFVSEKLSWASFQASFVPLLMRGAEARLLFWET